MKLLYQTHSPYARKVLVLAHEAGLAARLDVVHHETSPTRRNDEVYAVNPLGKVPVLVLDDGVALFDSTVICDFLDSLHGGGCFIPAAGPDRYRVLRQQSIAQGLCEAGIAVRHETVRRPAQYRYPEMRDGQMAKLVASYDLLEQQMKDVDVTDVDLGRIALATALDWIEFRNLPDFRAGRPCLTRWFTTFRSRPSMVVTGYAGETHD